MYNYFSKKILVIGLGVTGLSCVNFFLKKGIIPRIMDTRISPPGLRHLPIHVARHLGSINYSWVKNSTLIIISPGVSIKNLLDGISNNEIEIISDVELFCRELQKKETPIIAITGSNGKSTVTTLLSEMAKKTGLKVGVGGNIGVPVLELLELPVQLYILELSSFQLEHTFSLKATVATILNISFDHMDRYEFEIEKYCAAKQRIYEKANACVINAEDNMTHPLFKTNNNISKISFGLHIGDYHLHKEGKDNWLSVCGEKVFNTKYMKILGEHNYLNALATLALADIINIPRCFSLATLSIFTGLPHRCQLVYEAHGVRWINDSKSTNVASTKAACQGLQISGTLWLLLGGESKKADFNTLKDYLRLYRGKIRLFCFGKDGDILMLLRPDISTRTDTMEQAMNTISMKVQSGDVVLLSPACASMDQFLNFEHRGEVFTRLAQQLGNNLR